jgi:hypothetical protein
VSYLKYWADPAAGKIFWLVQAPDADAAISVHREAHGWSPTRPTRSPRGLIPGSSGGRKVRG